MDFCCWKSRMSHQSSTVCWAPYGRTSADSDQGLLPSTLLASWNVRLFPCLICSELFALPSVWFLLAVPQFGFCTSVFPWATCQSPWRWQESLLSDRFCRLLIRWCGGQVLASFLAEIPFSCFLQQTPNIRLCLSRLCSVFETSFLRWPDTSSWNSWWLHGCTYRQKYPRASSCLAISEIFPHQIIYLVQQEHSFLYHFMSCHFWQRGNLKSLLLAVS